MMMRSAQVVSLTIVVAAATCRAMAAAAPVVVTGTGNPSVDVPAVQAAVDRGVHVVLTGRLSFDTAPSKPAGTIYSRMVTVSRGVTISGSRDKNGEMPAIEGGFIPLFVDAQGSRVTIRGLRFVRPKAAAIWVYAVNGLVIAGSRFERVEPSAEVSKYGRVTHPVATAIWVGVNP